MNEQMAQLLSHKDTEIQRLREDLFHERAQQEELIQMLAAKVLQIGLKAGGNSIFTDTKELQVRLFHLWMRLVQEVKNANRPSWASCHSDLVNIHDIGARHLL